MFNKICEWFTRHYVPADEDAEFAEALFKWKYHKK